MGSLVICTWAAAAHADSSCERNEDCPDGFTCSTTGGTTTAECAAPCEAGKECSTPPDCKAPQEFKQCTPASCETDADCGERALCQTQTISECSGGAAIACAPNEKCMPGPLLEASCTERTFKECVAHYLLPCQQDNDCGDGFSCVAGEECMCQGRSPASDGGASAQDVASGGSAFAPIPAPKDAGVEQGDAAVDGGACDCHASELKHCELKELFCSSDADCPSDFACVSSGDAAVSCAVLRAGASDAASCEPVESQTAQAKRCAPRGGWAQPARGHDDSGSTGASGEGEKPSSAPQAGLSSDAGIGSDLPTADASEAPGTEPAACSVSAPGASVPSPLLVPFGFALLALGLRARRKQR